MTAESIILLSGIIPKLPAQKDDLFYIQDWYKNPLRFRQQDKRHPVVAMAIIYSIPHPIFYFAASPNVFAIAVLY